MTIHTPNPRPHCGFTLVEMLAVVVLLGLISSVAVVSLSRADEAGAFQSARWGFVNLMGQSRLAAQSEGRAVTIHVRDDGARLTAQATPASEGGWSTSFDLPRSTSIRFFEGTTSGGRALEGLLIDRTGRSADVTVRVSNASGRSERWFVYGLTGEIGRADLNGGEP